jgi:RNA polymerase sigma-70 factor (ECF subfamily)
LEPPAPGPAPSPTEQARWFAQEVHPHGPQLSSYLKGSFHLRDVDDVVQESFLRIWKAKATTRITSAKTYLYQIAKRIAIDHLRRAQSSPVEEMRDSADSYVLEDGLNPAELLITKEIFTTLAHALADLPDRQREIVMLHKLKGYTHKEIASELNLSPRTVEKHCYRGLKKCEENLRARGLSSFLK